MKHLELQAFLHKHCRIKLRSGKEVFGVLWEDYVNNTLSLFFASNIDHQRFLSTGNYSDTGLAPNRQQISFEDILHVESLN